MEAITSDRKFTEYERQWIKDMQDELPPVIARKDIKKFLGGVVSPQTLSNADAGGIGPEEAHRVGRSVAYKTEHLLEWIVQRFGVCKVSNAKHRK